MLKDYELHIGYVLPLSTIQIHIHIMQFMYRQVCWYLQGRGFGKLYSQWSFSQELRAQNQKHGILQNMVEYW